VIMKTNLEILMDLHVLSPCEYTHTKGGGGGCQSACTYVWRCVSAPEQVGRFYYKNYLS
jgi:hypothetical protein